jgi:hypothetical protein
MPKTGKKGYFLARSKIGPDDNAVEIQGHPVAVNCHFINKIPDACKGELFIKSH